MRVPINLTTLRTCESRAHLASALGDTGKQVLDIAVVYLLSQPDQNFLGRVIDFAHVSNLFRIFYRIVLINAERICPDLSSRMLLPYFIQNFIRVRGDVKILAVAENASARSEVSPHI